MKTNLDKPYMFFVFLLMAIIFYIISWKVAFYVSLVGAGCNIDTLIKYIKNEIS